MPLCGNTPISGRFSAPLALRKPPQLATVCQTGWQSAAHCDSFLCPADPFGCQLCLPAAANAPHDVLDQQGSLSLPPPESEGVVAAAGIAEQRQLQATIHEIAEVRAFVVWSHVVALLTAAPCSASEGRR